MLIRHVFIASSLAIFGYASAAYAQLNACSNVNVGALFRFGETDIGIHAIGTFRIEDEKDEDKQPGFNVAHVDCEKHPNFECEITTAVLSAVPGEPNIGRICLLDVDSSKYSMHEVQRGVYEGTEHESRICFNTVLTLDTNAKRVYKSFTIAVYADDSAASGTCPAPPRTEVLMNCNRFADIRTHARPTLGRLCDFSSVVEPDEGKQKPTRR